VTFVRIERVISFDSIQEVFKTRGARAGLDALLENLKVDGTPHARFRALLLQKRFELGLPLINPGDLGNFPDHTRKAYEDYVEEICRETGMTYLNDGKIIEAWRYFRTVGDRAPIRAALEKLDPQQTTDEVLRIALDEGVHPKRGFELVLKRDGLCRTITLFDSASAVDLSVKRHAAGIMSQQLYTELVIGVSKQIFDRFGEIPPEMDLVDLIRHRPWLFENANTHADPTHISAVSRYGLLCETQPEQIMTLSINEYGKLLDKRFGAATDAPFEDGFLDHVKYVRALLGENVDDAVDHFTAKLAGYDTSADPVAAEWIISLVFRVGQKKKALELWQKHLSHTPPDLPGAYLPSFYDLCTNANEFGLLGETARGQGDVSAWAGAWLLASVERPLPEPPEQSPEPAPAPVATPIRPQSTDAEDLS
jgi:hypothetical protein